MKKFWPDFQRQWQHFQLRARFLTLFSLLALVCLLSVALLTAANLTTPSSLPQAPLKESAILPTSTAAPFSFQSAATPGATPVSASKPASTQLTTHPVTQNEPDRLLSTANNFYNSGQYVAANAEYRLLLQLYPQNGQAASALYGLAKSTQADGQLATATQLFQQFQTRYPADSRQRFVLVALGDLAKGQGKWAAAIKYYQQYQQVTHLLDGYVNYQLGQVYDSLLQPAQAEKYYEKAAEGNASTLLLVQMMEKVGDYYAKANNYPVAVDWYNRILVLAKLPDYRASILLKLAGVYNNANQPSQANAVYNQLADQYLDTAAGQSAFNHLTTANPNLLDDYKRGYMAWLNQDYAGAVKDFNQFFGRTDANAQIAEPANLSSAAQAQRASAWFYMARSYELGGDLPKAITEYRALQSRYPQSALAAEALWRSATTLERAGATSDATNEYAKVANVYPNSSFAPDALLAQARILEQKSGLDAARPVINVLAAKYPASSARDEALFNLARTYGAAGNMSAAREVLTQAAQGVSDDYYVMRAQDLLSSQNSSQPIRSNPLSHPAVYDASQFAADIAHDRPTFEDWLLQWAASPPATQNGTATAIKSTQQQLVAARQKVESDTAMQRLLELEQIGWNDDADREAKEIVDNYSQQPLELYYLATELNQHAQYYYSIGAAKQLLALAQAKNPALGFRTVPLLLQKLIYPLDYQGIILEEARHNDLDPLLLLSLIKQESSFRQSVDSGAGARGLTQVMPSTGAAIASNLGKLSYSADDLYNPYTSIEFGAYYLASRLRDYNGNPLEALAAYNGGEGNVNRWAAAHPPSRNLDDFVENIDFVETRNYVKIVYTNYALYRQIYSVKSER